MKPGASAVWRKHGDDRAFDPHSWEFGSRQFFSSARLLIKHHDENILKPDFESILAQSTAQFLLALALELLIKAYYLRAKLGPREAIYTHAVSNLSGIGFFDLSQSKLVGKAERYVIWAGRYPTPKWMKETSREEYDVPSVFIDGQEHIDAAELPNSSSRSEVAALQNLYEHIHQAYTVLSDA